MEQQVMDVNAVFAEIGRLHLQVNQLNQQLAQANARIAQLVASTSADKPVFPKPVEADAANMKSTEPVQSAANAGQ